MVVSAQVYQVNAADEKQYFNLCENGSETCQSKCYFRYPTVPTECTAKRSRTATCCDRSDNIGSVDSNMNCKSAEIVQHNQTPPSHSNCNFIVRYFKKKSQSWSKDQFLLIFILSFVKFCGAAVVSIQAPFYPDVARQKGASASEYGFVFGVFELTVFIMSPLYGSKISYLGPTRVFNWGIVLTGTCCVIFGFLDVLEGRAAFIWTGFFIRIVEAMGTAAFDTAAYTIIALEFPNSVAQNFAILEIFVGLGLITGPTLGGALYEFGGFGLPFFSMGGLLFASAIATYFLLPDSCSRKRSSKSLEEKPDSTKNDDPIVHGGFHIFKMLQIPAIAITAYSIVASTAGCGFITANLDHHLSQFQLNKIAVGAVFMLDGGLYAVTSPIWGWICDNTSHLKVVTFAGSGLIILGFVFIGPIPYFPYDKTLPMSCIGLGLFSIGLSATLVVSFLQFLKDAIKHGYSDDISTYGLVSGLWTSMNALGFFIGPTAGCALMDYIGFQWVSVFIIGGQILLMLLLGGYYTSTSIKNRGSAEISTGGKSAADCEIRMEEDKKSHNISQITHPSLVAFGVM